MGSPRIFGASLAFLYGEHAIRVNLSLKFIVKCLAGPSGCLPGIVPRVRDERTETTA